MMCSKCKQEIASDAKFCANCGAPFASVNVDRAGLAGKFHRLCLIVLSAWTGWVTGLVVASSVMVGDREAHPGNVLGWTLGAGLMAIVWVVGAAMLLLLAIATKPSPSVRWPLSTKWIAAALALVSFIWPVSHAPRIFDPVRSATPSADSLALNQASAVLSLRAINDAEMSYALTYPRGFSRTLRALGPSPSARQDGGAAGLIDGILAAGSRSGYTFKYKPGTVDDGGRVNSYTICADPVKSGVTGLNHYFTDETHVIRQEDERPASKQSRAVH